MELDSQHLSKYMNERKTPRQHVHQYRMSIEWLICLLAAGFVYTTADKIYPESSFIDRNMFVDYADKKALRIKNEYLREQKNK